MKKLVLVLMIIGSLISCDKAEDKPDLKDMAKSVFASLASGVVSELLECSNKPQVTSDLRSAMGLDDKALDLGALFPCKELVSGVLPQLIKDGVIPAGWECKASKVDLSLDKLSEKICNQ